MPKRDKAATSCPPCPRSQNYEGTKQHVHSTHCNLFRFLLRWRTAMKQSKAAQLKDEGNILYTRQDYLQAYIKYTEAIAEDHSSAVLYTNRAACCLEMKKFITIVGGRLKADSDLFSLDINKRWMIPKRPVLHQRLSNQNVINLYFFRPLKSILAMPRPGRDLLQPMTCAASSRLIFCLLLYIIRLSSKVS